MSYLGTNKIGKMYLGSTAIGKAYLGNNLVFQQGGGVLPYDAQIEYLESTGDQWIDTGVLANDNTKLEMRFSPTSINNRRLISTRTAAWQNQFDIILYTSTTLYVRVGFCSSGNQVSFTISASQWYDLVVDRRTSKLNGTSKNNYTGGGSIVNPNSIILYAGGGDLQGDSRCLAKIAYCKLYEGDTLKRNFIPVRVGTVGYMYDKVSKQLFENLGTVDFILGPDL